MGLDHGVGHFQLGGNNGNQAGCLKSGSVAITSGKCLLVPGDHIIPDNLTVPPTTSTTWISLRKQEVTP